MNSNNPTKRAVSAAPPTDKQSDASSNARKDRALSAIEEETKTSVKINNLESIAPNGPDPSAFKSAQNESKLKANHGMKRAFHMPRRVAKKTEIAK